MTDQIKSRPKRLDGAGRAQTVSTSLTASQYGWLLSQGPSVAHTLRELVSQAMAQAAPARLDYLEHKVQAAEVCVDALRDIAPDGHSEYLRAYDEVQP